MKKTLFSLLLVTSVVQASPPKKPPSDCETPASLGCVYGLTKSVPGCPIKGTTINPGGGWGAIAVVEEQDNPSVQDDLNIYSDAFNLPHATVDIVYAPSPSSTSPLPGGCPDVLPPGSTPPLCSASCDEHVADIEMAHAMAPNAKLIMVESHSGNVWDRLYAVCYAKKLVAAAGGGIVSMSYSTAEFAQETGFDAYFQGTPNVIFVASSGDYSAPARYPSTSPYVISAGGTSIMRNAQGSFVGETAWNTDPTVSAGGKNGGSGGPSLYEPRPAYQNSVMKIVGNARGTPDISFDSDPSTGVCVYSTLHTPAGWFRDGGTSMAAPALSGIINSAHSGATSTTEELNLIYSHAIKNYHSNWRDIVAGNNGFQAMAGYDFTTGLGSPIGYRGK